MTSFCSSSHSSSPSSSDSCPRNRDGCASSWAVRAAASATAVEIFIVPFLAAIAIARLGRIFKRTIEDEGDLPPEDETPTAPTQP